MTWTITLPWPRKCCSPNARCNRFEKARAIRADRHDGGIAALAGGFRAVEPGRFTLSWEFRPRVRRGFDDDNLTNWVKALRDGVAKAGGVDDACFRSLPPVVGDTARVPHVVLTIRRAADG